MLKFKRILSTQLPNSISNASYLLHLGNGNIIAATDKNVGNNMYVSTDGITWTLNTSLSTYIIERLRWNQHANMYSAVVRYNTNNKYTYAYLLSSDLQQWTVLYSEQQSSKYLSYDIAYTELGWAYTTQTYNADNNKYIIHLNYNGNTTVLTDVYTWGVLRDNCIIYVGENSKHECDLYIYDPVKNTTTSSLLHSNMMYTAGMLLSVYDGLAVISHTNTHRLYQLKTDHSLEVISDFKRLSTLVETAMINGNCAGAKYDDTYYRMYFISNSVRKMEKSSDGYTWTTVKTFSDKPASEAWISEDTDELIYAGYTNSEDHVYYVHNDVTTDLVIPSSSVYLVFDNRLFGIDGSTIYYTDEVLNRAQLLI